MPKEICKFKNYKYIYHVVNVLPIVQGNELKGCKHWPQQIVKTSVTEIRIVTNVGQTNIILGTWSEKKKAILT